MKLYFGTALDKSAYPQPNTTQNPCLVLGPTKLLSYLEDICLSPFHESGTAYAHIRLELCRTILSRILYQKSDSYFSDSFKADPFGTAKAILEQRDELLLNGYTFPIAESLPKLQIQHLVQEGIQSLAEEWPKAFADRFDFVRKQLQFVHLPITQIILAEPLELLPYYFRELFQHILRLNPSIQLSEPTTLGGAENKSSDLAKVQNLFASKDYHRPTLSGDGSLQVWTFENEADAAQRISKLEPNQQRLYFIPDQSNSLDRCMSAQGIAPMGMASSAPIRPGLMLLKSASVFLWDPLNVYHVIDFLKLPSSPFDKGLARQLINEFANAPGFDQLAFEKVVNKYLREQGRFNEEIEYQLFQEYEFWFVRDRFDPTLGAPKKEVIDIYQRLDKIMSAKKTENQHYLLLKKLNRQLLELLAYFNGETISRLELEQIINSIFQAAPIQLNKRMVGAPAYINRATAMIAPVPELFWWNAVQENSSYQFSVWSEKELEFLAANKCIIDGPALETKRKLWRKIRPLLLASNRLIFVLPHRIKGEEKEASSLITDILERCDGSEHIMVEVSPETVLQGFEAAPLKQIDPIQLKSNNGFIQVDHLNELLNTFNDKKDWSYSSLNKLFYHPYNFAFHYLLKLRRTSVEHISQENRVKGIIGHYLFEHLFQVPGILDADESRIRTIAKGLLKQAFEQKGSIFLLYGKEPEKQQLSKTLIEAAVAFQKNIIANGWSLQPDSCEKDTRGQVLNNLNFRGIMDIVLYRGEETLILDLKWYKSNAKVNELSSKEDLQLILYALLEHGLSNQKIHTAYFLFKSAQFIARNNQAIQSAKVVSNADGEEVNEDQVRAEVAERMIQTFNWRKEQLNKGLLEVYLEHTATQIEDRYDESDINLLDYLELKTPYEDYELYRNLIGLVE